MGNFELMFVAIAAAFLLVGMGFLIGGLLPRILKNSVSNDIEAVKYLKSRADGLSGAEVARSNAESVVLEKQLYNLELSLACILGEKIQDDLKKERSV